MSFKLLKAFGDDGNMLQNYCTLFFLDFLNHSILRVISSDRYLTLFIWHVAKKVPKLFTIMPIFTVLEALSDNAFQQSMKFQVVTCVTSSSYVSSCTATWSPLHLQWCYSSSLRCVSWRLFEQQTCPVQNQDDKFSTSLSLFYMQTPNHKKQFRFYAERRPHFLS